MTPLPPVKTPAVLTVLVGIMIGIQGLLSFGPEVIQILIMGFGAFFTDFSETTLPNVLIRLPTLVTYALLHGGWMHLIFNAMLFIHLGRNVAHTMGPLNFCLFFGLCAAGGALFHMIFTSHSSLLVGASACVFGVAAARGLLLARKLPDASMQRRYIIQYSVGWMLLNAAIVLFAGLSAGNANPLVNNVAWQAHLGGYVVGLATADWFWKKF